LLVVHPGGSGLATPGDHVVDALVIVSDIPGEDRLMVRDPVSEPSYDAQIGVSDDAALCDGLRGRCAREAGTKMGVPDAAILASGKNLLPEGELQFGNNLACCWEQRSASGLKPDCSRSAAWVAEGCG
jgi:hypothetical protein